MDICQHEINTNLQLLNDGHITKEEFDSERDLFSYRKHQKDCIALGAAAAARAAAGAGSFWCFL